ncbi:MAG: ABC transporter substrate-binding protein, partial [Zoogloea sp.]|nr:ABC transporter substrate-binding protein [Zoogloea sp.]
MENKVQENYWADALGQIHRPHDGAARIVSLVPSLTELVCDLGFAGQLVGRTGFCIHPKETLKTVPKVGGTKDVNIARLRELEPTHVIVNIDENRRECVEEIAAFVPHVIVTHPCAPEDNLAVYRLFGGVFDRRDEAGRLEEALRQALEAARVVGEGMPRERVLYL